MVKPESPSSSAAAGSTANTVSEQPSPSVETEEHAEEVESRDESATSTSVVLGATLPHSMYQRRMSETHPPGPEKSQVEAAEIAAVTEGQKQVHSHLLDQVSLFNPRPPR
jgi:hypothetical protein